MNHIYYKSFKSQRFLNFLGLLGMFLLAFNAIAQTNVDTDHIDNNGSGLVTFNVQNTNPYSIILTEVRANTNAAGQVVNVLYNPVPTTNVGSWTAGTIDIGQNGWLLVGTGTSTAVNATGVVLQGASLLTIPANTTYQFCVSTPMGYMTLTSGAGINTYSGGGVNILTGDGISWGGGSIPAAPVNYPRGFVGGISFIPGTPPLALDAGITSFVTPSVPACSFAGPVSVVLTNFGSDTLTTAQVNWQHNGLPQSPISWTGSLAQFQTDTVVLGTVPLAVGSNLLSFTSIPNGMLEDPAGGVNDSTELLNLQAGLSGIYTIGGIAPDYVDIPAAITALTTYGVCSAVTFDIRDGVYPGQIILPALSSMSSSNTVTFRSENSDPALVTISFGSTSTIDNYVIRMNNLNHYHFENLTLQNTGTAFCQVLVMTNSSDNSFKGCFFKSSMVVSTSTNTAVIFSASGLDNNNLFFGNTIEGGSYGMYWYGNSAAAPETGNVFDGNTFLSNYYRGAQFYYNNAIEVKNNIFEGTSVYGFRYAMYFFTANAAPKITGNIVRGTATSGWQYGIYMGTAGGNNAVHGLIANNMMSCGWAGSTAALNGIFLTGAGYIDVYHNSVLCSAGSATSRAFYATAGGGIEVKNNIFANYTAGHAIYVANSFTISNSDHNLLYSPSGFIGFFGSNQQTLANWQTASAFDASSINYNPNFYSSVDLHACNDSIGNQGTPLSIVTEDVDLHPRSAITPDMGADEFNGITGSFLGSDVTICAGDSIQLFAGAPSDTILWSPSGDTTSAIWVNTPDSYVVVVSGACGTGTDAIVVNPSAINYSNFLAASSLTFCSGDTVVLYSTQDADSYSWTGGSTNDTLFVTSGGTYALNITDECGSGSEAVTVTMQTAPTSSFTHSTSYLAGIFTSTSTSSGPATYSWNFGDNTTSILEDPTHVYNVSGVYYVTLTVTNACGTTTYGDSVNIFVLGLYNIADFGKFNLSPNPSNGIFNLDMDLKDAASLELQLTNSLGQIVSTEQVLVNTGVATLKLDLSKEASGVYYLNILSDDKKVANRMLIKQ